MPVFSETISTLIKAPTPVIFPISSRFLKLLRNRSIRRRSAALFLPVLFLCLLSWPGHALAQMASIKGEKVNMRARPTRTSTILWELGNGYPLKVLKKKRGWLKVKDFEGDMGWVYRKLTSSRPHLIVKKKLVNIRKKPSSRSRIIGKARYGVVFATLRQYRGWVKVKHQSGLIGWIRRDLLWGW